MASIFITGSADGLGKMAAQLLVSQGHSVTLHARNPQRVHDALPAVFAVNTLAPYILTCLIQRPKRLIYLSSGLHRSGNPSLEDLSWERRRWNGFTAYSDSKLFLTTLAFAVARKWKEVYSNSVEPGWVATKMGGAGAPDSLEEGPVTQAWLAVSMDKAALISGHHWYHKKFREFHPDAANPEFQDQLLDACAGLSGVPFPENPPR